MTYAQLAYQNLERIRDLDAFLQSATLTLEQRLDIMQHICRLKHYVDQVRAMPIDEMHKECELETTIIFSGQVPDYEYRKRYFKKRHFLNQRYE